MVGYPTFDDQSACLSDQNMFGFDIKDRLVERYRHAGVKTIVYTCHDHLQCLAM